MSAREGEGSRLRIRIAGDDAGRRSQEAVDTLADVKTLDGRGRRPAAITARQRSQLGGDFAQYIAQPKDGRLAAMLPVPQRRDFEGR